MRIVNCTPHPLNIVDGNNKVISHFPKGEKVPRLLQSTVKGG